MAFSASMAELAAVSALKAVYAFLNAMPPDERYTATGVIGGRASCAASLRRQVFWTLAHQLADKILVGKNSQKLSEQLLSILLADAELLASIAPDIAAYGRPVCVPSKRDASDPIGNTVPVPLVSRKRTRPSNAAPVSA